ncbi:MAG: dienelactone hydrolase family protein [Gammaproteobacteria bacterium]|nr:dienelactone hydrolase family protein [Gammaproteobacteria bacterium]
MNERYVDITTKHGAIPSFLAAPGAEGQWPAIILYMDAPGIREELRNIARRIAKQGYVCVLPDLYHRYGTLRFDMPKRSDAMSVVIRAAYLSLTDQNIAEDTAGIVGFLEAQPEVQPGKIGSIGFCMSGRFVTTAARDFPERFACAASLYGTRLVTDEDDSPHKDLSAIKAEMYYGFGDVDQTTPPDYIETFRKSLDRDKVNYSMDVFKGVDHGYSFVERAMYDAQAAEASWAKTFDLFKRNLSRT